MQPSSVRPAVTMSSFNAFKGRFSTSASAIVVAGCVDPPRPRALSSSSHSRTGLLFSCRVPLRVGLVTLPSSGSAFVRLACSSACTRPPRWARLLGSTVTLLGAIATSTSRSVCSSLTRILATVLLPRRERRRTREKAMHVTARADTAARRTLEAIVAWP